MTYLPGALGQVYANPYHPVIILTRVVDGLMLELHEVSLKLGTDGHDYLNAPRCNKAYLRGPKVFFAHFCIKKSTKTQKNQYFALIWREAPKIFFFTWRRKKISPPLGGEGSPGPPPSVNKGEGGGLGTPPSCRCSDPDSEKPVLTPCITAHPGC